MSEIINAVVPIDAITPHPRNYKKHPESQIYKLKKSHERFKQYRSVVIWQRPDGGYIQVAGHGIVKAMKERGVTQVRADILPEDTPQEDIDGILAADNLLPEESEDDEELLATLLQEQQDAGFDLAALGTDDETLRQMLEATTQASSDDWASALEDLPDGDKSPFQQMTFTLTNEQADMVKEALDLAQEDKDNFGETGNMNSNGNALAYVVKFYLDMGKVAA